MGVETERIMTELTAVLREVFDDDLVVSRDLTADRVQGWDSVAYVRLLLTIERKFRIRIRPADVAKLKTVGDLADVIETKCAARVGG